MNGLQDIRFEGRDRITNTVQVIITDDCSQYAARVDYAMLLYALQKDLGLEASE